MPRLRPKHDQETHHINHLRYQIENLYTYSTQTSNIACLNRASIEYATLATWSGNYYAWKKFKTSSQM